MNRITLVAVPLVAVTLAAGYVSVRGRQIKAWEGTGGKKVEFVGACSISEADLHCWNASGDPDAALADRISTFYKSTPYPEVPLRYAKKNRLAAFRVTGDMWIRAQTAIEDRLPTAEIPGADGSKLLIVSIATDRDASTGAITLMVDKASDTTIDVPVKNGQKATLRGMVVEIGTVTETEYPRSLFGGSDESTSMPSSSILMGANRLEMDDPPCTATPLDKDKKPIKTVDLQGKPTDSRLPKGTSSNRHESIDVRMMWGRQYYSMPEVFELIFNVNLRYLAYLRISKVEYEPVPIVGIPLEPHK